MKKLGSIASDSLESECTCQIEHVSASGVLFEIQGRDDVVTPDEDIRRRIW